MSKTSDDEISENYMEYYLNDAYEISASIFKIRNLIHEIFSMTRECDHKILMDIGDKLLDHDDDIAHLEVQLLDFEHDLHRATNINSKTADEVK